MPAFIKWNPVNHLLMWDDAAEQMGEQFQDNICGRKSGTPSTWSPIADMYETETEVILNVELAGVDKRSLSIIFQDGYLLIQGSRPFGIDMQSAKIHRIEQMYGDFQRAFWVPVAIDAARISASYEHGILKIVLIKETDRSAKQVNVPITFK